MTRTHRPSSRRTRVVAAVTTAAALAVLASGCGTSRAGAAATLGEVSVGTDEVAAQVAAVHDANGEPVDQVDETLTRSTVERLVRERLVGIGAQRLDVEVTQGSVDAQIAGLVGELGGRENVDSALLQSGVPPTALDDVLTMQLQAEAMARALAPDAVPQEQQQALLDYVIALSDELDVTVSPRFGTWDAAGLSVGPRPTDISVPAAALLLDDVPPMTPAPSPS